jgi:hypothetical protein
MIWKVLVAGGRRSFVKQICVKLGSAWLSWFGEYREDICNIMNRVEFDGDGTTSGKTGFAVARVRFCNSFVMR